MSEYRELMQEQFEHKIMVEAYITYKAEQGVYMSWEMFKALRSVK